MIHRLLVVVFLTLSLSVNAQGISPNIQGILNQTMAVNGYLNKDMHQAFWAEVKGWGTAKEIDLMKKIWSVGILSAQEYQKELWASAKISYENLRVVKTQRLIELETELPIMFEKSLSFPKGSSNYNQAMAVYRKELKVSMDDSNRLLVAASKRTSITFSQGQVVALDVNVINTVLANLKSSFTRVQNLFNENWVAQ